MHFTSELLVDYLFRRANMRPHWPVLDLGTGTGVVAIAAALAGAKRVVASDINPTAVQCAALNVRHHALEKQISVRQGDMFATVTGERFDLVVCNPPYFRGEPTSMAERAYLGGPALEWLTRFGSGLADHLSPNGSAIISIGDAADIPAILAILADCGWSCTVVARRDILVESIFLFKLTRAPKDKSIEATRQHHASDTIRDGNPDWYVRPFKAHDENGLLSLYERAFRRPRDRRHWQWKLLGRQAPFNLLWVAVADAPGDAPERSERVVGHYGGIPIHIKLGDHTREAVHAVEAMTDPLFRRQGMLTQLGGTAHATWAEAGQWLVTGLPNEQWGTRNRALGYLPVFPLSWLRFPLHLEHALARRPSVPLPLRVVGYLPFMASSATWRALSSWRSAGARRDVTVRLASEGEPVFDAIWAHASPGWRNVQVRDNNWVHWRYLQAAPNPYTVAVAWRVEDGAPKAVGYSAYRVVDHGERRNGYMADLFVARSDASAARALVRFALRHLSEQGAGTVMTLAPPGGSLYKLLLRFGFLPTRSETAFGFEIVPLRDEISVQQLSDPRDWHLTGGDFDVI